MGARAVACGGVSPVGSFKIPRPEGRGFSARYQRTGKFALGGYTRIPLPLRGRVRGGDFLELRVEIPGSRHPSGYPAAASHPGKPDGAKTGSMAR